MRGFHKVVWPAILKEYEIVEIERMFEYEHGGNLVFLCKPDLLVRSKSDGSLHYIEYKSTSSIKERWFTSWETAIQLHSAARVVESVLGEPLNSIVVQGLYKGWSSYGKQSSPFCYGYLAPGDPPFYKGQWRYDYAKGFRKSPIWERSGGVKQWVEDMPLDLLSNQFPQAPPIYPNEQMIDAFFQQTEIREGDVEFAVDELKAIGDTKPDITENIMSTHFRQNFNHCSPTWGGFDCDFLSICHGGGATQGFKKREPHHEAERVDN